MNEDNGLVLVFDLDDTLVASTSFFRTFGQSRNANYQENAAENVELNLSLMYLLKVAVENKEFLSAVLLLSNSRMDSYGDAVLDRIEQDFLNDPLFDAVAYQQSLIRNGTYVKDLPVVGRMLEGIGKSSANLESRVLFFDDQNTHVMPRQFTDPRQYIQITPPFQTNETDQTNYSYFYERINQMKEEKRQKSIQRGGYRHKKTRRRLKLKRSKARRSRSQPSHNAL